MSKLKRAQRYVGKTIKLEGGGTMRVTDVDLVSVNDGSKPYIYHPSSDRRKALVFRGVRTDNLIRDYERVNSRARHEVEEK